MKEGKWREREWFVGFKVAYLLSDTGVYTTYECTELSIFGSGALKDNEHHLDRFEFVLLKRLSYEQNDFHFSSHVYISMWRQVVNLLA